MNNMSKKQEIIGLIDADLLDNGTRHPNLVLLKLAGFFQDNGIPFELILDPHTNGKTNCSIFKKHFVPGLPLLTQNKMCILLQKNRGNLFSCLYFRSEPSKKINGWVKCWILPIL